MSKTLLYVHPGAIPRSDTGQAMLPQRSLTALRYYAALWPGKLVVTSHGWTTATDIMSNEVINEHAEPFELEMGPDAAATAKRVQPNVILALHHPASYPLLNTSTPVVLLAENHRINRRDMSIVHARSTFDQWRIRAGSLRSEVLYRRMAHRAAGLQTNGFAAQKAYGTLNKCTLNFHDHRIFMEDIHRARTINEPVEYRPRRLAFSGRFTAIKGPLHAMDVAKSLFATHPHIEFEFMGAGDLEPLLHQMATPNVIFRGSLDFESEWKAHVTQNVDLLVLPHVQGDPSCTYFEALGTGTPIVAFPNATSTALVATSKAGWTSAQRTSSSLIKAVTDILQQPSSISRARNNGLDFMGAHDFETESQRRILHLLAVAR